MRGRGVGEVEIGKCIREKCGVKDQLKNKRMAMSKSQVIEGLAFQQKLHTWRTVCWS